MISWLLAARRRTVPVVLRDYRGPCHPRASSVPSLQALSDRVGAAEFRWPGCADDASLVFVTEMLARRFRSFPARVGRLEGLRRVRPAASFR